MLFLLQAFRTELFGNNLCVIWYVESRMFKKQDKKEAYEVDFAESHV